MQPNRCKCGGEFEEMENDGDGGDGIMSTEFRCEDCGEPIQINYRCGFEVWDGGIWESSHRTLETAAQAVLRLASEGSIRLPDERVLYVNGQPKGTITTTLADFLLLRFEGMLRDQTLRIY